MDDPVLAWKLVNVLWGVVLGIGALIVKHFWVEISAVKAKVYQMEVNALQNHVTKDDLEKEFKNLIQFHIAPLNRDIGALIRALAAQEIHIEHPR